MTDPWDLLKEAKGVVQDCLDDNNTGLDDYPCNCEGCERYRNLIVRIDAALAERQDSATEVVESEVEWNRVNDNFSTAYPDHETGLTVSRFDPTKQEWRWDVEWDGKKKGYCATEAEAKAAAIAAARGNR